MTQKRRIQFSVSQYPTTRLHQPIDCPIDIQTEISLAPSPLEGLSNFILISSLANSSSVTSGGPWGIVYRQTNLFFHCNQPTGGLLSTPPTKGYLASMCTLCKQTAPIMGTPDAMLDAACSPGATLGHQVAKVEGGVEQWGMNEPFADWLFLATCVP